MSKRKESEFYLAAVDGYAPPLKVSKTFVLLLYDTAMYLPGS